MKGNSRHQKIISVSKKFHLVSVKQQRSKYLQKTGFFRSPRDLLIEKKVSKSFKQETKASKSFKQETKANEFTNT